MADESTNDQVDRIASLSPRAAKAAFIRTIDPMLSDHKVANLSGYKGKQGHQVKTRINGALGPFLEDKGITAETIAEKLLECLNANKFAPRNERTYDEKGRPVTDKVVTVDLGPDYAARLKAAQTLILIGGFTKKEQQAELPPPQAPSVPQDRGKLEAATGRGPQIVDAEFEVTDVEAG